MNTANGVFALSHNTNGSNNTADGAFALRFNTTGSNNTAVGLAALETNTTGTGNTALGAGAGDNILEGNNNIHIGNSGVRDESGTIRIGDGDHTRTFIAGISGVAVTGTAVVVDGDGQLGVAPSSQRFKTEIKPMDKASEAIHALKPVTSVIRKRLIPKASRNLGSWRRKWKK